MSSIIGDISSNQLWFGISLLIFLFLAGMLFLIKKKIAFRLGLGDLRRHKKEGYIGGIAEMIAHLVYYMPSQYQILRIRLLILAIIILAPEGSGLFLYITLWFIIPSESDEERDKRINDINKIKKMGRILREKKSPPWKKYSIPSKKIEESSTWTTLPHLKKSLNGLGRDRSDIT
jgi:phage shock protein PspC (stress-responsive transcriptional regulator)